MAARLFAGLAFLCGAYTNLSGAQEPIPRDGNSSSPPIAIPVEPPRKEVLKEPAPLPPAPEPAEPAARPDDSSSWALIGLAVVCLMAVVGSALSVKVLNARSSKHVFLDDPWVREKIRREALLANPAEPKP